MSAPAIPSEENDYLSKHVALLRGSYRHWLGRDFLNPRLNASEAARFLFAAPFAVLSHDTAKEPIFNYANQTALNLFGMDWESLTRLPSRISAEPVNQAERAKLLETVAAQGYIDHYQGIRIGRHGRRFRIDQAVVWNLLDASGIYRGQAALFHGWEFL